MGITVFLTDDHTVFRDGLRYLLEAQSDIKVIGDAANGRDAVKDIKRLNPNIVIMDIAMAGMNGIEATEQITQKNPATQVIILSMYSSSEHILRSFNAGARGYLLKESAGSEVVDAIRSVHAGNRYLSRTVSDQIWDMHLTTGKNGEAKDPLVLLSRREREVLQLVVEGKTSSEIAEVLFLSPKTVDTYRARIMHKLNIKDIPNLTKFAIQHGLIALD
jgi:DNA-binding NarL/FixJ family response regulator